jgi:hypothetical protein
LRTKSEDFKENGGESLENLGTKKRNGEEGVEEFKSTKK